MNNPVLYQVGLGVLTLFFFFLMYMFTKTWRWPQVTIMFFVYCASIAFVIHASMTLRTHDAWRRLVSQQRLDVQEGIAERDKLLHGDLNQVIQTEPTIRDLHSQLGRELLDRGRVWRNCQPAGQPGPDGSVTVSTVPVGVAEGDAPANNIAQQMILYVFTENLSPPAVEAKLAVPPGHRYPHVYIGEFTATAVTNTTVTLSPTRPLTNFERSLMSVPGVTWALYESMPVDGHQLFALDPHKITDLTKNADEEAIFGDMDEQLITVLMARAAKLPAETDEQFLQRYAPIIQRYVRDGKRAATDDPPENRWLKVRFLLPHEEPVDSTASAGADISSQDSEPFFDRGMAELELLKRAEPAKFRKNDVAVFPENDANALIRDGICEPIEPIYVRSLANFEYTYRKIARRLRRLEDDIALVQRNTAKITAANGNALAQIDYRQQEKAKLQQDLAKFVYEQQQITQYANTLQTEWANKRAELSRLYRSNYQLAEELARIEGEITERVNRLAREAVARTP